MLVVAPCEVHERIARHPINRIDELRPEEVDELAGLIGAECPGVPVVRMSAKTGAGFDALRREGVFERTGGKPGIGPRLRIRDPGLRLMAAAASKTMW